MTPSAHFPKFAIRFSNTFGKLRKAMGTSKLMILVPLIDLKSLKEFPLAVQGLQIGGTRDDTLLQCGDGLLPFLIRNIPTNWGCRVGFFQALGGTAFGPAI